MNTLNTTSRLLAAAAALSATLAIVQGMTGIAAQERAEAFASLQQPVRIAAQAAAEQARRVQVAQADIGSR